MAKNVTDQQIMGDAYRFVKKFSKKVLGILPKKNSKASPGKTLFYSPDYKVLYDEVLKDASLTLLNTAEMVLANYDYQTIDTVSENELYVYQDDDGQYFAEVLEYTDSVVPSVNATTANIIYAIQETTVSDIDDKLNNLLSNVYSDILQYFGKYNSSNEFVKFRPGYTKDGRAYYDMELPIVDISGVLGYNIYMIEEDDVA
jgi:hypothetical protein